MKDYTENLTINLKNGYKITAEIVKYEDIKGIAIYITNPDGYEHTLQCSRYNNEKIELHNCCDPHSEETTNKFSISLKDFEDLERKDENI